MRAKVEKPVVGRALLQVFAGHRVVRDASRVTHGPDAVTSVTAQRLEMFLEASRGRRALALADLASLQREPSARLPFMLTFDDGFRDFATVALPLLEKYDTPALLFVTTAWINGTDEPYEYLLAALLARAGSILELDGAKIPINSDADRHALYDRLRLRVKKGSPNERRALLRKVGDAIGTDLASADVPPLLSAEELRALDHHELVTIGAHSAHHRMLSVCGPVAAWAEINGSQRALSKLLGHEVAAIAYPYGDQTRAVRTLAWLAGFRWGFTTRPAPVTHLPASGCLQLPRFDLAGWEPDA